MQNKAAAFCVCVLPQTDCTLYAVLTKTQLSESPEARWAQTAEQRATKHKDNRSFFIF